jgi:hypothetical protein
MGYRGIRPFGGDENDVFDPALVLDVTSRAMTKAA